ncbi:MAG: NMD3-related protein [Candidatus Micrarchaeia archaeon]
MTKYCPICNKSSDEVKFFGEICEYCTADMLRKKLPSTAKIYTCRFCGRVKAGADFEKLGKASLARALQHQLGLSDCKLSVDTYDVEHRSVVVALSCYEGELNFKKEVKLDIEHKTCQMCYRMHSGYYEAVLQLRGGGEAVKKMMARFSSYVERHGAFIAREEEVRNGYDLYVSDKLVANGFFDYYRLKPAKSYELYGMKRGKKVYRNIYALSL